MNRERTLTGGNGYTREIGFNPVKFLQDRVNSRRVRWLDLCCGTGNALIEAVKIFDSRGLGDRIEIVGVDLAGMFSTFAGSDTSLKLIEASLTTWQPDHKYDLITCVHGLHYIGDKLGLIQRAVACLTADGTYAASFSVENVRIQNVRSANRIVAAAIREVGLIYDSRRKRLTCQGYKSINLPFRYLGADDRPGPNYTGQAAVDSHYELLTKRK